MFRAEQTLETKASPSQLWAVLIDVEGWPAWNPGLRSAAISGPLEVGSRGQVTLTNGRARPFTVWEAEAPRYLRYGSRDFGNEVAFIYRFEPHPGGGSRVTVGTTIRGWLSPLLGRLFGRIIAGYLPDEIQKLTVAAESAHAPTAG